MRWKNASLMLVAFLVIGSCASAPPVPADKFYRLPDPVNISPGPALTDGVIRVERFEADGVHGERAVVFSDDGQGVSLQQHHYHFWADAPPLMLQHQLISYLRAAGAADIVVHKPSSEAALIVSGRIKRFERDLSGSAAVARIVLELSIEANDARVPLLIKDYEASVTAASDTLPASVTAFAQGISEIFAAFLIDARVRLQQQAS